MAECRPIGGQVYALLVAEFMAYLVAICTLYGGHVEGQMFS